ncbi:MAG: acylphosphatase [Homoserinimonas sp.]|jgi:acylphosphatase|nr:acylphosphatase [Homoserinimonas sp.]
MIRKHVIVRGVVQGVGFRWNTRHEARRLGVTGYARNLADGTVEVEVEGSQKDVDRMVAWLHHGPPFATVSATDVSDVPLTGVAGFEVG